VLLDGVPLPEARLDLCAVDVVLPAHAAGPVDFVIRDGEGTYTMRSSVEYVDPAAAPDERFFERVLIPVLYNGAGQFGSQWVTEAAVHNLSFKTLGWFNDVARPPCTGCERIEPRRKAQLSASDANGHVLFLPREEAERIFVGALSRDVSRGEGHWGAELPVAREKDFKREVLVSDVPIDARYRITVRAYDLEGLRGAFGVAVLRNGVPVASKIFDMTAPCTVRPCNSSDPDSEPSIRRRWCRRTRADRSTSRSTTASSPSPTTRRST
jgi:hypothetical protein